MGLSREFVDRRLCRHNVTAIHGTICIDACNMMVQWYIPLEIPAFWMFVELESVGCVTVNGCVVYIL